MHNAMAEEVIAIDTIKNIKLKIHLITRETPEISRFCQFICSGLLSWVDFINKASLYINRWVRGGRGAQQMNRFNEFEKLSNKEYLLWKLMKSNLALIFSKWIIASYGSKTWEILDNYSYKAVILFDILRNS